MRIQKIWLFLAAFITIQLVCGQNTQIKGGEDGSSKYRYNKNAAFNASLTISESETLVVPVRGILPVQYLQKNSNKPLVSSISQVVNSHTHRNSRSVCNIIRAPINKSFRIMHKLNHKIKNQIQWQKLAIEREVIYKLEDLSKLQYALDIDIINNYIVLIFQDGQVIFYQLNDNRLKQIARKSIFKQNTSPDRKRIGYGKFVSQGQYGIYVSSSELIAINGNDLSVQFVEDYEETPYFYTAILSTRNDTTHLMIASGKQGIKHFTLDIRNKKINKLGQYSVKFEQRGQIYTVSTVDIVQITHIIKKKAIDASVYIILDPNHGILRMELYEQQVSGSIRVQRTAVKHKNCRLMRLHSSDVYVTCPQVVRYDPVTDQINTNTIIAQLPLQIISTPSHLTLISHTSFQIYDHCSGAIEEGRMEGHSFQHTIAHRGYYISIDDISIVLWKAKYSEYFLACKANSNFKGNNGFLLNISSVCESSEQCCIDMFKVELQIYDSSQGFHLFEIIGTCTLIGSSLVLAMWILLKKRKVTSEYNKLVEDPDVEVKHQVTQNTEQSMHNAGSQPSDKVAHVEIVQ